MSTVLAQYFDGTHARAHAVWLAVESDRLVARAATAGLGDTTQALGAGAAGDGSPPGPPPWSWPLADVQWPERTRHGRRVIQLRHGGSIECEDTAAFDSWRAQAGPPESWVVRAQQQWRSTLVAVLLLVLTVVAGYRWGVPWLAEKVTALVPAEVESALGQAAFDGLARDWLAPSRLPPQRQAALREAFGQAVAASAGGSEPARWQLHFYAGGEKLGANAFALPGGHIVITDEMVELLHGQDDAVLGVLAHEYGHVRLRHGMQAVARLGLVSAAAAVAFGDFSQLLAAAPALLAVMAYSRDAEREADAQAVQILRASGRSPSAMVVMFERLKERRKQRGDGAAGPDIALASHPPDEERIQFFRDAARAGPALPR